MLSLENLSAGYGGFQALFDVNLDVKAGEAVAVIGPNGAGKTTLLRAISKLVEPTAGGIFFESKTLAAGPPRVRVSLGASPLPPDRRPFARPPPGGNPRIRAFSAAGRTKNSAKSRDVLRLF